MDPAWEHDLRGILDEGTVAQLKRELAAADDSDDIVEGTDLFGEEEPHAAEGLGIGALIAAAPALAGRVGPTCPGRTALPPGSGSSRSAASPCPSCSAPPPAATATSCGRRPSIAPRWSPAGPRERSWAGASRGAGSSSRSARAWGCPPARRCSSARGCSPPTRPMGRGSRRWPPRLR
ncbi:unnamed protein product [Prorocentrum cordatum]|uniref:Uncharacterized protein n=1 Tax=Prorocentrum cordatum TaxID=2364126 RepID=A0ABN9V1D5_9DINO|nr:unnamed protein product [Polarella glacialis]